MVILFCGIIDVAQEFGALDAASVLFQPILRVIMGIPGAAGLALVGSFTSVDVGSVMTKELYDDGKITDDERTIFVAYQNAGSAIISNLLTTGAPLMAVVPFSFATMFGVCMVSKLSGLMDIISMVFRPIMGVFGLPGEAVAVLVAAFLAKASGCSMAALLYTEGVLTLGHCAILMPACMIMGTLIGGYARIIVVSGSNRKYHAILFCLPLLDAAVSMWIMRVILMITGIQ